MNSSTSASSAVVWRRLLRRYIVQSLVLGMVLCATLVLLDPYDTGRFGLFPSAGVANFGPRFTAASIARQPQINAATLGSSTFELIDPAQLTSLTGLSFVSLAIHGTGPVEQLAVAHWLIRHHDGVQGKVLQALVIGVDTNWCRNDGRLEPVNPFPFWLYSDSTAEYLGNLVDLKGFEAAQRRLKLLLHLDRPERADGYRDYESGRVWDAAAAARQFAEGTSGFDGDSGGRFVAADRLRVFLPQIPAQTVLALVFVPRHHSSLSPAGSLPARQQARCKDAFRAVAESRARTVLVDLLTDNAIARDDGNWWDRIHYRTPVARMIETRIAEALRPAMAE